MTIDERLQDALRRRGAGVVPTQPEWSHVARRLGRPAPSRRRLALASGVAALAAVMVAVIVWVGRSPDPSSPIGTFGPPSSVVTPPSSVVAPPTSVVAPPPTTVPGPGAGPAGGPVPAGFRPVSATWISPRQGWVLGTAPCSAPPCTSLVRTTDGGASWVGVPAPRSELDRTQKVRFADPRNGWIYGPDLWATHDGGSTWRRLDTPGGDVVSLETAGGAVYAVERVGGANVFTGSVDSDVWRQAGPEAVAPYAELTLQGDGGYVMGADGAVLALSPTGLDRRGSPCGYPSGAVAVGGSEVFAVCVSDAGLGSSTKTLMVSIDGARTWSAAAGAPPRGGQPSGLAAASPSTIVVAANSGASFLYRTEDGGKTWTTVFTDSTMGGAGFADLGFTTPMRGVAVLGGSGPTSRLLLTDDGGLTWSTVDFRV